MTSHWLNSLVARPDIQSRLSRIPLIRRIVRHEGAVLFDLVQGFVRAQVLFALVESGTLDRLAQGPAHASDLAPFLDLDPDRTALLLRAGVGIGILDRQRGGAFALGRRGAALMGVPGLADMILHHSAFYRDMADPLALLRREGDTELSRFWPYVFGAGTEADPDTFARYSDLMARSQVLVAQETLDAVSLSGTRRLLDIGGGTGAFLMAAAARNPTMDLHLFDLPSVASQARNRLTEAGLDHRATITCGSFQDDDLPGGADTISLIRVLYDHSDATVRALLKKVYDALPPGGRLIVSEPMSGGDVPDPATDVYFAFYTLAMKTGRTRSPDEISRLCRDAGFDRIDRAKIRRPYITATLVAHR